MEILKYLNFDRYQIEASLSKYGMFISTNTFKDIKLNRFDKGLPRYIA